MADTAMNVALKADIKNFETGMLQGITQLNKFATAAKATEGKIGTFGTAVNKLGLNSRALQTNVKNSAFQIQDFAVQIASGTSATRAMAQQLPQLLSGFGLFGALAGTAAAILVPLAANMFTAGKSAKTFEQSMKDLKGAASEYTGSLRDIKEALSDPAWSNTAFGKMMIDANRVLEQVALVKFRDELKTTAQSIATEFGQIEGSIQKTGDVVKGIDGKLLKSVDGLKEVRNQYRGAAADIKGFFISINSNGDVFLNLVKGLRNYGVEANKAAQLTKAFMDAIKSGDPKTVATAVDALNKEIERTGIAAGKSKEEIAQQQAQLAALAAEMGGVISTAANLRSAWATLGAQAVATASQISTLVAQMSQLNLVGAASTWESIKSTYSAGGAAGVVNNFTKEFTTNLQASAKAVIAEGEAIKDSLDPKRAVVRETARLADLEKAGVITKAEYTAAVDKLNASLVKVGGGAGGGSGGGGGGGGGSLGKAADGVKKLGKELKDAAAKPMQDFQQGLQDIAKSAAQGVFDALMSIAEGSKSAREAFSELAKSMLKQIAQLIFELTVLKPLMNMFGGGLGVLGGGAGAVGMASRSMISSMSATRSTNIGNYQGFAPSPTVMQAVTRSSVSSAASATPVINQKIEIINNAGVNVRTQQNDKTLQIYLDMASEHVADQITRGGNRIDQAMQRAFGARRVGY